MVALMILVKVFNQIYGEVVDSFEKDLVRVDLDLIVAVFLNLNQRKLKCWIQ